MLPHVFADADTPALKLTRSGAKGQPDARLQQAWKARLAELTENSTANPRHAIGAKKALNGRVPAQVPPQAPSLPKSGRLHRPPSSLGVISDADEVPSKPVTHYDLQRARLRLGSSTTPTNSASRDGGDRGSMESVTPVKSATPEAGAPPPPTRPLFKPRMSQLKIIIPPPDSLPARRHSHHASLVVAAPPPSARSPAGGRGRTQSDFVDSLPTYIDYDCSLDLEADASEDLGSEDMGSEDDAEAAFFATSDMAEDDHMAAAAAKSSLPKQWTKSAGANSHELRSPSPSLVNHVSSMPTHNPHVARLLASMRQSPFRGAVHLTSAPQLTRELEANVYYTAHAVQRVARFRPEEGDVMVLGVPRSGQTPVLRALDALRRGVAPGKFDEAAREALAEAVTWVEHSEDAAEHSRPLMSPIAGRNALHHARAGRLVKSHLPISTALHGDPCPRGSRPMYRAVVVLRDPGDVRVSWFRHLRRVFKKFHPDDGMQFDTAIKLDDFAKEPAPRAASILQDQFPEHYVADALRFMDSPQICVIFYEELLIDARNVVDRLAMFTGWSATDVDLVDRVAAALEDDELSHPKWGKKKGSSGAAITHFSHSSLRVIEDKWDQVVRSKIPRFESYAGAYRGRTEQIYPLPVQSASRGVVSGRNPSPRGSAGVGLFRSMGRASRHNSDASSADLASLPSTHSVGMLADVDPDDPDEDLVLARHGTHGAPRKGSTLAPPRRFSLLGL